MSYRRQQSAASLFRVVMDCTAAARASGDASPTRLAVQMIPTPSRLVSSRQSPGRPPLLRYIFSGSTTPVTDRPYFTSLSAMEWPPASTPPDSMTFSAPPRRISPRMFRSIASGKQTMFRAVLTAPPMA